MGGHALVFALWARARAVAPSRPGRLGSALAESKARTMSAWSERVARCSGVQPSSSVLCTRIREARALVSGRTAAGSRRAGRLWTAVATRLSWHGAHCLQAALRRSRPQTCLEELGKHGRPVLLGSRNKRPHNVRAAGRNGVQHGACLAAAAVVAGDAAAAGGSRRGSRSRRPRWRSRRRAWRRRRTGWC